MRKLIILIAVIMGFAFVANVPAYALKSTVDIDALKEEIKQELLEEKPWNEDLESWGIDIHGFVSQGYLCSSSYNYLVDNSKGGSFHFNEIGINFGKDLTEKLRIGVQLLARDLGDLYNNKVEIDWAYADYHWKDWLGIRAGVLKVPMGLYHESRDIDILRTFVLLPSAVYHEPYREFNMGLSGIGIYGAIPMGRAGSLDYVAEVGAMDQDADDSGISKVYADDLNRVMPFVSDFEITAVDIEECYVGSLQWRTLWGLRLGATLNLTSYVAEGVDSTAGITGVMDTYDNRMFTYSAEYTWENLVLAAEYWNNKSETKSMFTGVPTRDSTMEIEGYYVSASYRVNEWLELGTYYSMYWPNARDHEGDDIVNAPDHKAWSEDIALATRIDINEYWTFKLEGHRINGTGAILGSENGGSTTATFSDQRWWMFAAKMTFSF